MAESPSLGTLSLPIPVFLAPMAGVTNSAYRRLCREQAELGSGGIRPAGVFTCEMITARGVAERINKTFAMMAPDSGDTIMSVQLYGTDPETLARAIAVACGERGVTHVDLNFGCPVPKVTRKGGGGVLPWKLDRFEAILRAAVQAAQPYDVPVTFKTRIGLDDEHVTMYDAARLAEECGIAAITLHARTVEQAYAGKARWEAIAALVNATSVPIIGNGDIWEAADALRMREETGCAGVAIGRGALGRPWLFRDLAAAMVGGQAGIPTLPTCGQVCAMVRRHAELLVEHFHDERHAMSDLRKHMAWYFKGFHVGGDLRQQLGMVASLTHLDDLLAQLDPNEPFPARELHAPRGRQGSPRTKVTMPYGWLDSRTMDGRDLGPDDMDAVSGG
ncbi:MAG: tRNA dihydrouridine synthase DusB [Propionibacteriaceae bacterium]|jgi:nifR3 family TIM-barrel protein|nr:tRNA dihydrouridine synthase DusB [Propionibacteriaceae bacterium]